MGEALPNVLSGIPSWSNGAYFKWSLQTIGSLGLEGKEAEIQDHSVNSQVLCIHCMGNNDVLVQHIHSRWEVGDG